jgi:hypothetical protein
MHVMLLPLKVVVCRTVDRYQAMQVHGSIPP